MKSCKSCKSDLYHEVIHCLVSALEYRDTYTKGHSSRVGDMALELANMIGLDESAKELVHVAGHLHDIGKIGIPDHILNKTGPLTDEEWETMKSHPQNGSDIVHKCSSLDEVADIIEQHHERWDGRGYPKGIKGDNIHYAARMIALCDAIDAMSSNRPYRNHFTWDFIRQEIKKNSGLQFDPNLVMHSDQLINLWIKNYESSFKVVS